MELGWVVWFLLGVHCLSQCFLNGYWFQLLPAAYERSRETTKKLATTEIKFLTMSFGVFISNPHRVGIILMLARFLYGEGTASHCHSDQWYDYDQIAPFNLKPDKHL